MRILTLTSMMALLLCVSCRLPEPPTTSDQTGPALSRQVEFRISNQSLDDPLAYVTISLDDRQVFYGGLHVAGQHNVFRFITGSEKVPASITITTNSGHPPPEGKAATKQFSVKPDMALRFDITVHGTNIFVHQVEAFAPIS